jgi:hypothetical protein
MHGGPISSGLKSWIYPHVGADKVTPVEAGLVKHVSAGVTSHCSEVCCHLLLRLPAEAAQWHTKLGKHTPPVLWAWLTAGREGPQLALLQAADQVRPHLPLLVVGCCWVQSSSQSGGMGNREEAAISDSRLALDIRPLHGHRVVLAVGHPGQLALRLQVQAWLQTPQAVIQPDCSLWALLIRHTNPMVVLHVEYLHEGCIWGCYYGASGTRDKDAYGLEAAHTVSTFHNAQ